MLNVVIFSFALHFFKAFYGLSAAIEDSISCELSIVWQRRRCTLILLGLLRRFGRDFGAMMNATSENCDVKMLATLVHFQIFNDLSNPKR